MFLLPAAFKMGVVTTMIFILVLLALKNLIIGKTILLINVAFIFFKLIGFFAKFKGHSHGHDYGHYGHYARWDAQRWDPHKNVHVHIHNSGYEHAALEKTLPEYSPPTYSVPTYSAPSALPLNYPTSHQSYRSLPRKHA